MAGLGISLSSKCQHVSQQDTNIMMTCMDCQESSLPPHPTIPTAFTLFHPISSIAPNSFSHFTPCLLHQPWVILLSSIPTLDAYPSYKQRLHVPCLGCGFLYVTRVGLACHQTSCTTHKQSSAFGVLMPLALSFSPPSLAWI